jgi:hypothetical protein
LVKGASDLLREPGFCLPSFLCIGAHAYFYVVASFGVMSLLCGVNIGSYWERSVSDTPYGFRPIADASCSWPAVAVWRSNLLVEQHVLAWSKAVLSVLPVLGIGLKV